MTSQTIAVIGGIVLPLLVAIVTRADAPPAVKAVVNGLLAAVAAWVATVIPGTPIDLKSALVTIGIAWGTSIASYFGLWKPSGVTDAVASATSNFGVGKPQ